MLLGYIRLRARGIIFLSQIFQLLRTSPSNSGYICHRWRLQSSVGQRTFLWPKERLPILLLWPLNVLCPRTNIFLLAALSSPHSSSATHLPPSALQVGPFLLKQFRYLSWIDLWSLSFSHTHRLLTLEEYFDVPSLTIWFKISQCPQLHKHSVHNLDLGLLQQSHPHQHLSGLSATGTPKVGTSLGLPWGSRG